MCIILHITSICSSIIDQWAQQTLSKVLNVICLFVWVDALRSIQHFISHVGRFSSWTSNENTLKCLAQWHNTYSDSGEARTSDLSALCQKSIWEVRIRTGIGLVHDVDTASDPCKQLTPCGNHVWNRVMSGKLQFAVFRASLVFQFKFQDYAISIT